MIPKAAFTFESSLSFSVSLSVLHTHTHTPAFRVRCQLVTHQKPFPDAPPHQPTKLSASRSEHLKLTLNQDGPWPRPHCELPGKGTGFRPSLALACDLLHPRTHVREVCAHRLTPFHGNWDPGLLQGQQGPHVPMQGSGVLFQMPGCRERGFCGQGQPETCALGLVGTQTYRSHQISRI